MPPRFEASDLSPAEVRDRFRWARRQGQAAWLWPDTPIDMWREALRDVEETVRSALAGKAGKALNGDPTALGLACYTSGLGPLLGHWHAQGRVDASPAVGAMLALHLQHNRMRAEQMETAAVQIIETLTARGIAVAVLKGAHTGPAYFGADGVRPASDVDLLVHGKDMAAAERTIAENGYVPAGRGRWESSWRPATIPPLPRSLEMVHSQDPWSLDLHGSLNVSASSGAPVARLDEGAPMSSRSRWQACPAALVLDQPLLLLHLAVHAGAGLHNLSLLRLTELALVIREDSLADRLSWDEFLAIGSRTGSLGYAFPALKLCTDLAADSVPAWVLERCAESAPAAVRHLIGRLEPASAQRIDRSSITEHFMWADGWSGRIRQLASDLVPSSSLRELRSIYARRAWAVVRGKISL